MTDFGKRTGDMFKSSYDTDNDGTVDDSQKLEASTKAQVQDHTPKTHTHTEAQITDLVHDATKIKAVDVDDAAIADGKVLTYQSASGNIEYITPAPSGATINNIQQVSITLANTVLTNTATITAVVMANTVLLWNGFTLDNIDPDTNVRIALTNTTTVTATREVGTNEAIVKLTVVEFTNGTITGVQRGTIAIPHLSYTATATINAVTLAKAVLLLLGFSANSLNWSRARMHAVLTNTTTITATSIHNIGYPTLSFEVLEFL